MKVVILAGGKGTRISEESTTRPKPMIAIGDKPILWHIMKIYSHYGFHDFVICLGYKGHLIKEYFASYRLQNSDITVDLKNESITYHRQHAEPWRVTLIDTGEETQTGGRLKRVAPYLDKDEPFFMTYGDGVSNVDIAALAAHHRKHGLQATVTAVQPPGRFGALQLEGGRVTAFTEKPMGDGGLINGGFFVLSPKTLDLVEGDATVWEKKPMEKLASGGQLSAFFHSGFWQPMDTLRDKNHLEALWESGSAPWKVWA